MLIENLNMQIESEIADLIDRKLISLYGLNNNKTVSKVVDKKAR